MLVLTRNREKNEIMIGEDIVIKILDIYKSNGIYQTRIGISAPRNITVHRKEIYDRIKNGLPDLKKEEANGNK